MPWARDRMRQLGRKDARHAHQIAGGDAGRAQRELERGQLLAVLADTLGEEHLLGDESDHVTLLLSQGICMVNSNFPSVKERGAERPRCRPALTVRARVIT